MKYREWKAKTMTRLIEIARETTDPRVKNDVDALMRKLTWLKSRDISIWLSDLYQASKNAPQLLQLAPTAAQVEEWFSWHDDD
ncbi:MAG: hypothetical protein QXE52_08405 [Candidatus Caldarchaeum sp.]